MGSGKGGRSFLPRPPSLPHSRLDSLAFSLATVIVRYHQLRAWNRITSHIREYLRLFFQDMIGICGRDKTAEPAEKPSN